MLQNKPIKLLVKMVLGLSLLLWMSYAIFRQVKRQINLEATMEQVKDSFGSQGWFLLLFVFLLMILNWTIEAIKWRFLVKATEPLTIPQALQSVLTGVAVSMITPNRIGEYMGRILHLRNVHKLHGITLTIVGSFAQWMVTSFLGLVGLMYYLMFIQSSTWLLVFVVISAILFIVLGYFYFHLAFLVEWIKRFAFLKRVRVYLQVVLQFDRRKLVQLLFFSLARYFVYTLQFIILMHLFLVKAPFVSLLATIWLVFWAMAIIPTIAIAELGIRGETALFFLLPLCNNSFGIVSSTVALWLINLILPSIIGCLFIYRIKIYDDE